MADSDLPVWSFRANWKDGVTERLEFLTDVIRAKEGAEQRRCLRDLPRRTVEADFLLRGPERTFYDLFINRLGAETIMVPLYWDVQGLTARTVATTTTRLNFANTYREFVPGLAIIMGKTALDYEVVEIASMDAGGVNLAAPTARAWPVGSKLMPLRRGIIDDVGQPEHLAGGVATLSARLQITAPNEWTPSADPATVYDGRPVFLDEPNWVDPLTTSYDRETVRLDTTLGIPYQADPLGRALLGQAHRWFLPGRQRLAEFRDLLYRRKGRAGSFWLPTFKHDLRLANSPGAAATQITVENVGYLYTGGPTSGREYIAIKHAGGTILRKVLSVVPGLTPETERLNLDSALGLDLSPGLVHRISFADVGRFDQDDFEIQHHAGIDGLAECSARFRTFKATRTAPLPISFPIRPGIQNSAPCGVNFNGVFLLVEVTCPDPCNECWGGNRTVYIVPQRPNGPLGKLINDGTSGGIVPGSEGPCAQAIIENYENIVPGNQDLQGQLLTRYTSTNFNTWKCEFFFPCIFDQAYIFPSARYCASVGKGEGLVQAKVTDADGSFIVYGPKHTAGIDETNLGPAYP